MSRKRGSSKQPDDQVATTTRRDRPELEGGTPLPQELTGRASGTEEDLDTLFANDAADHFADGFRGGSNDDPASDIPREPDTGGNADEDVTAV